MDIKENFYSKLQQIREESEQLDEISKEKIKKKKNPGLNDRHGGLFKITKGTYMTGPERKIKTKISHEQARQITKALRSEKDPEKKSEKWKKFWNTGSLEEEQLDELRGYQGRKGQKLLDKVQRRAVNRMIDAADSGDAKSAKRNQGVANAAWERMKEK